MPSPSQFSQGEIVGFLGANGAENPRQCGLFPAAYPDLQELFSWVKISRTIQSV